MSRRPPPNAWTAAEDAALIAGHQAGHPIAQIAAELGRSLDACYVRATTLRARGAQVIARRLNGPPRSQWTDERCDELIACIKAGWTVARCADRFDVSHHAITSQAGLLRVKGFSVPYFNGGRGAAAEQPPPPGGARGETRACMCCGTQFRSAGPHNRLCNVCRKQSVGPYDMGCRVATGGLS